VAYAHSRDIGIYLREYYKDNENNTINELINEGGYS
jgi:hypothetical protein